MMHFKACVIGDPVAHSLSPYLHGYWLKEYGIEGSYTAEHVEADALEQFFTDMRHGAYVGCNITLPHKEKAVAYMDKLSDRARRMKAVNTVLQIGGELHGDNTDGFGFYENLKQHLQDVTPYLKHVVILGAGGATRAIAYILEDAGAKITLLNRTKEKAEVLASELKNTTVENWEKREDILADATMLINTTNLGMSGKEPLECSLFSLPDHALVTDIVYAPLMTPLLKEAQNKGCQIVTGIGMLLHQARPGFEAWFGQTPTVTQKLEDHVLGRVTL